MDLLGIGIVLLVLYGVMRLFGRTVARISGSRNQSYLRLAQRYHGRIEDRGMVDPPTVIFLHQAAVVRVGLAPFVSGQKTVPRTRVVARFPTPLPFRLDLFPFRGAPNRPLPRGTRLVHTGIPVFDRRYVIQANDLEIARDFLTVNMTMEAIETLHRLSPPGGRGMVVSVHPDRLLVQVNRDLGTFYPKLEEAVESTLTLLDELVLTVADYLTEGIAILEDDRRESSLDHSLVPICKVCNQPIEPGETRVLCASCKTPHHRDCWLFVGTCSIYGCQSKKFVQT